MYNSVTWSEWSMSLPLKSIFFYNFFYFPLAIFLFLLYFILILGIASKVHEDVILLNGRILEKCKCQPLCNKTTYGIDIDKVLLDDSYFLSSNAWVIRKKNFDSFTTFLSKMNKIEFLDFLNIAFYFRNYVHITTGESL